VDFGGRHVDDRRLAGDRQRFLERAQLQRDVQFNRRTDRDLNAVALKGAEAGQLIFELVGAGRQQRKQVRAGFRRDRCLRALDGRAAQRHRDPGHDGARFIDGFPDDFARGALRHHRGCEGDDENQNTQPTPGEGLAHTGRLLLSPCGAGL
jgi:hypothetical protein